MNLVGGAEYERALSWILALDSGILKVPIFFLEILGVIRCTEYRTFAFVLEAALSMVGEAECPNYKVYVASKQICKRRGWFEIKKTFN